MYVYLTIFNVSRQYRIEQEVRNSRMTKEQLQELEKELIKKEAVERKTRSEQARQRIEEIKQREIEEVGISYM